MGISLALGGGGARGFAHIGVLRVLHDEGLAVDEIAGTSMGAVVGAYYALHGDTDGLETFVGELSMKKALSYVDPSLPKYGLMKGEKFRALLSEWFGDQQIEDARIPLAICATNLGTGKGEIFREGPIVDTLLASTAIPGLLPAAELQGNYYVDGGLELQVPVAALNGKPTVAVELPLYERKLEERPSMIDVLTLSYAITRERSQRDTDADVVLRPDTGSFYDVLDFGHASRFVEAGDQAARDALSDIKRLGS